MPLAGQRSTGRGQSVHEEEAGAEKQDIKSLDHRSFKNKGVQTLLDYVCAFLPSPLDTPNIIGTNPDTGLEEERKPDDDGLQTI